MSYICNFISKKGFPLVLTQLPEPEQPVLSIENCALWDDTSLYLCYNDGECHSVLDDKFMSRQFLELAEKYSRQNIPCLTHQGIYNPAFIEEAADIMGYNLDSGSLDMIVGRWERRK